MKRGAGVDERDCLQAAMSASFPAFTMRQPGSARARGRRGGRGADEQAGGREREGGGVGWRGERREARGRMAGDGRKETDQSKTPLTGEVVAKAKSWPTNM